MIFIMPNRNNQIIFSILANISPREVSVNINLKTIKLPSLCCIKRASLVFNLEISDPKLFVIAVSANAMIYCQVVFY